MNTRYLVLSSVLSPRVSFVESKLLFVQESQRAREEGERRRRERGSDRRHRDRHRDRYRKVCIIHTCHTFNIHSFVME